MAKKDLFKFPSKKTLEYILIGILFVAVLSCTMKMMNISFNNILEGFDCDQRDVGAATCTRLPGDTPATAKHFIGDTEMSELGTGEANGTLNITFVKPSGSSDVDVAIDSSGRNIDVQTLFGQLQTSINSSNVGSEVIVFKSTDNKLNILTLPDSEITDIRMRYAASASPQQTTEVGNLQRVLGVNDFSSLNVSDKETCEQYFTLLEGNYGPRTNPEAIGKIRLGGEMSCLSVCEEEYLGECPSDGVNSGCALNSDSDTCVCGGSTGLGSFVRNSGYNFDDNDVDNCLKSQITEIYYGREPGTLGTRPGGWTTDGTGDVCSPRRPCLDNQEAYLNIIRKPSTSDTKSENCNPDNDYGDNEMRLNFCQPFGEDATFDNCNKHDNQTDCETEGSTDNEKCTWNPYCLSQEGLDEVIGGVQANEDRLTCQGINDHQSCDATPQCYWDWILAEELNGFRDANNIITEDTPKIEQLKNPGLFTTYLSNCQTNGGMLDNSKCSFYSAIQTLNSTDNRAKGYCRKEDCDYDEGTEHSLCSYCSTFALEGNTPSIVPETISDFVEWTREMTGTSNSQSQQATPNQCYQIFRR